VGAVQSLVAHVLVSLYLVALLFARPPAAARRGGSRGDGMQLSCPDAWTVRGGCRVP